MVLQWLQDTKCLDKEEVQNLRRKNPVMVVQVHAQVSVEQMVARYESFSSDESMGSVAVHYRIAAKRESRQKEMKTQIAKLEVEFKASLAGGNDSSKSDKPAEINDEGRSRWRGACP